MVSILLFISDWETFELISLFFAGDGPSCSTTDDEVRAPIAPVSARLLDPHHDVEWDQMLRTPRTNSAFDGLRDFAVEAGKCTVMKNSN